MRNTRLCHPRALGALVAAGALALSLAACSGDNGGAGASSSGASSQPASGSGGDIRIGALYLDSQGYYGGVKKGVQEAAASAGKSVKLVETTSSGDVAKESQFMDTLISSGVDAIIISAVSTDGSVAAVKAASDAGIPVICYNTCVNQDAIDKYVTAYILGDPVQFGQMIGEYAGKFYADKGITDPKFGVVNCEQYEVCQQRQQGFEEALKKQAPGATVVVNQEGTEADSAVQVAEQELTAHPEITGMFGQSGGATVGAFKSVINRGKTGEIYAFGSDMTTDIATALKDGTVLKGIVDISGIEVGNLAFSAAFDAINGKAPAEKVIPAPIKLYTPDDAQQWLDDHPDGLP